MACQSGGIGSGKSCVFFAGTIWMASYAVVLFVCAWLLIVAIYRTKIMVALGDGEFFFRAESALHHGYGTSAQRPGICRAQISTYSARNICSA